MILTHGANSLKKKAESDFVVIGDKTYPIVKIGNLYWMAENLDYKFDVDGSQISINPRVTPSTPAAWYYNKNELKYGINSQYKVGLLYNFYAVKYLENNKMNLLPNRWRVPILDEVIYLKNYVGDNPGTKLKSETSVAIPNWSGTNDYGFSALPTGLYDQGVFRNLYLDTNLWTSSEQSVTYGHAYGFDITNVFYTWGADKLKGYALRLVKDAQ